MFRRFSMALVCAATIAGQSGTQIAIADPAIAQYEDGGQLPGQFEFAPGDPIFVSMRFTGYTKSKETDEAKSRLRLTWRVEAFDADGVPFIEPKSATIDAELHAQDKNWSPKVRHDFVLPSLADSGTYKVVFSVKDELNGTEAKKELPLRVKGHEVERSDKLVARNFRWQRSEDEGPALATPAYRQGDQVWARFDMTGYKIGDKNMISISYGLEVFDASGKSMYKEPVAAGEKGGSFYRKRYLPGTLSLNLQKDTAKGEYTIVLRLRDELGNQTAESRHSFLVE